MEAPPSSEEEAMATLITIALVVFLSLAAASAYAAGWLLYQLCAQVFIPLFAWLWREGEKAAERLHVWYREVTWRRRMLRMHNETLDAIDAVRERQVALLREMADEWARRDERNP
jgi:uncharacterized membrane protein